MKELINKTEKLEMEIFLEAQIPVIYFGVFTFCFIADSLSYLSLQKVFF